VNLEKLFFVVTSFGVPIGVVLLILWIAILAL
jgi:hypothetical protein